MRIAIIDDDADERKTLQASFERLAQESGSAIVIIEFAGADDFLDGYDRSFDLICMDIDMPGTDGMSAAQRLRQMDADVPLVFVTNMAQMAIHGYAVHALDFILKPINYYSFSIKMRGILALIGNRRGNRSFSRRRTVFYAFHPTISTMWKCVGTICPSTPHKASSGNVTPYATGKPNWRDCRSNAAITAIWSISSRLRPWPRTPCRSDATGCQSAEPKRNRL